MKKVVCFLLFTSILLAETASAQQLLPPIEMFSNKKESFLVKNNGDTIKFFYSIYKFKKKAIVAIVGKDATGAKTEYKAEDTRIIALPPADFGKYVAFLNANESVTKSKKTNQKAYNREMVYFFSENVDGVNMLLQMLNPDFSSKIRIYHDPFAKETMGWGVGGVTLVGNEDKSYFIKENGKTSKIQKKDYKERFVQLFGKCPKLLQKYPDAKWSDFAEHVFFFENECE
ncbi:MAG: hypothetical protein EAZ08_05740 [Cytophagales bacterium]|nr:MAG: hypothetical protein EAZ08_05740 [Cytophagales bacterium]